MDGHQAVGQQPHVVPGEGIAEDPLGFAKFEAPRWTPPPSPPHPTPLGIFEWGEPKTPIEIACFSRVSRPLPPCAAGVGVSNSLSLPPSEKNT